MILSGPRPAHPWLLSNSHLTLLLQQLQRKQIILTWRQLSQSFESRHYIGRCIRRYITISIIIKQLGFTRLGHFAGGFLNLENAIEILFILMLEWSWCWLELWRRGKAWDRLCRVIYWCWTIMLMLMSRGCVWRNGQLQNRLLSIVAFIEKFSIMWWFGRRRNFLALFWTLVGVEARDVFKGGY